ncbi:MAG: hypothetical protein JNM34_06155 [Chthonomonadaceae bacterium]|nr:hypothetical protein [Chthonomonadaceae bacterium]
MKSSEAGPRIESRSTYWRSFDHMMPGAGSPGLDSARWVLSVAKTVGWQLRCPLKDFGVVCTYSFFDGPEVKKGKPGVTSVRLDRRSRIVSIVLNYTFEEFDGISQQKCIDRLLDLETKSIELVASRIARDDPDGSLALKDHSKLVEQRARAIPDPYSIESYGRSFAELAKDAPALFERLGLM